MTSVTDRQWIKWGKQNPYYGILGVETSDFEQQQDAFFQTGVSYMDRVFTGLTAANALPGAYDKALDFGCGAGRLLRPMIGKFETLVGVDVSEDQIALAKQNLPESARFVRSLDELAGEKGTFDFVNTFVVLQHIRPEFGYGIIGQLLDLLRPGGAFALHMTFGDVDDRRRRLNWWRYRLLPLHWAYNISRKRPWDEPVTEMNAYDASVVAKLLLERGIEDFSVQLIDNGGYMGLTLLGRKD